MVRWDTQVENALYFPWADEILHIEETILEYEQRIPKKGPWLKDLKPHRQKLQFLRSDCGSRHCSFLYFMKFPFIWSHLSVVSLFYCTCLGVYLSSAATQSSHSSATASVMYTVVTPMLNPFIYSLRNKDIKKALKAFFRTAAIKIIQSFWAKAGSMIESFKDWLNQWICL